MQRSSFWSILKLNFFVECQIPIKACFFPSILSSSRQYLKSLLILFTARHFPICKLQPPSSFPSSLLSLLLQVVCCNRSKYNHRYKRKQTLPSWPHIQGGFIPLTFSHLTTRQLTQVSHLCSLFHQWSEVDISCLWTNQGCNLHDHLWGDTWFFGQITEGVTNLIIRPKSHLLITMFQSDIISVLQRNLNQSICTGLTQKKKKVFSTSCQTKRHHSMADFSVFHEDYTMALLETCVTSINSSVFFYTGKRAAPVGGDNKTVTWHRNATKWQNWIWSVLRCSFFEVDKHCEQGFEQPSPSSTCSVLRFMQSFGQIILTK